MGKVIETSNYELERGKPMPSKLHSITQSNLIFQLQLNYREKYRSFSELSLSLDGWDSVPDICLYAKTEIDFSEDEVELTTPPLCAIEIISPSQSINELRYKAQKYFEKGVRSCWLVLPVFKNVYVFASNESYEIFKDNQTLKDTVLSIEIPLAVVFK